MGDECVLVFIQLSCLFCCLVNKDLNFAESYQCADPLTGFCHEFAV